jgi:hypothetical protein
MYQIVYASTASQEFTAADLKKLLLRARMRNKAAGVTGMLVFHDGAFLQALEGEKRAVVRIFDSIDKDPRHREIAVLHCGPGPEQQRVFGDWAMGFADLSGAAVLLKGFTRLREPLNLDDLDSTRAMELLVSCGRHQALSGA